MKLSSSPKPRIWRGTSARRRIRASPPLASSDLTTKWNQGGTVAMEYCLWFDWNLHKFLKVHCWTIFLLYLSSAKLHRAKSFLKSNSFPQNSLVRQQHWGISKSFSPLRLEESVDCQSAICWLFLFAKTTNWWNTCSWPPLAPDTVCSGLRQMHRSHL